MERRRYGFTLVEATLTLAIGGLILLGVFIALPGAFRNQRDGERRDDMLLFINRLKNFQANNNRGALPSGSSGTVDGSEVTFGPTSGTTWKDFYASFFNDSFVDPISGKPYNLKIVTCKESGVGDKCSNVALSDDFDANNFTMHVVISASCKDADAVYSANPRNVALLYVLESGIFCVNT